MRLLMDHLSHSTGAGQSYPPTPQRTSLISSPGKFWDEWQIQCLILVSFGLQVFLFLAAGMRRRSASRVLGSLLWLAYLLADSVAIFVLGHLALHANGSQHQLLFFWTPFVLFHLGGQDTVTAFAMQDNDLWKRHLLGLVTQVAAAGYVISRTSWPDRRLLAAMVLMFLSGFFKYVERTICLYRASSTRLTQSSLVSWEQYAAGMINLRGGARLQQVLKERFIKMVNANGRRHSSQTFNMSSSSSGISLVSDTPMNDGLTINAKHQDIQILLQELKSNEDRCRVYNYVSIRPVLIYERLYTKAPLRFCYIRGLSITYPSIEGSRCFLTLAYCCLLFRFLVCALLLFFPFFSTLTALVLFFKVVEKGQFYSRVDVIVSYILLTGAIMLEVASLFVSILSFVDCRDIFQSGRKQWSEMLGQYSMTRSLTRQDTTCIMSFVPHWIGKHLDDNTSHIPVSGDLKKFVLDKLCDLGTREQDRNFASFHGKLALRKWMDTHKDPVSARLESSLNLIITDLDLPTSVLILHIATDILYFHDNKSINSDQQTMKKMSRELSNYIMYLVFKCGAMLTSRTKLLHDKAQREMKDNIFVRNFKKDVNVGEKEVITKAFEAYRGLSSPSEQAAQMLDLKDTFTALTSPLLSRASDVAQELLDIHRQTDCWDLVAAVWVEMLYYIAPRCGGAFHSHHLSTGGEFVTHVLFLMQLLGPFIPPPSA